MTLNQRFDQDVKRNVKARIREGMKAVLEEVLDKAVGYTRSG